MQQTRIRHCKLCGKEFRPNGHNQAYCSLDCSDYAKYAKAYARERIKVREAHCEPLINKAHEADVAGLSYGQYVAMTERGAIYG